MGFTLFPERMKQWKVVLIAFATATTFWFFNALNKNYTTTLNYPVVFNYATDSLVSVKPLPENVELDVSGGGWNLLRRTSWLNPRPLQIDLKKPAGMRYLQWMEVLPAIRDQIGDLTINRVLQDTLRLQIEPIVSKVVRVKLDSVDVQLKENFRLVSVIRIPTDTVILSGPKSFIDTLASVYPLRLEESGISSNFNKNVPVQVPRPSLISASPAQVNVQFDVDRFDRLQIEIPIEPLNFPADSSRYLALNQASVFFTVRRSLRGEYTKKNFTLQADLRSVSRRDTVIAPVLVAHPDEISEIEIAPALIKILRQ